jgi:hypothetical protein
MRTSRQRGRFYFVLILKLRKTKQVILLKRSLGDSCQIKNEGIPFSHIGMCAIFRSALRCRTYAQNRAGKRRTAAFFIRTSNPLIPIQISDEGIPFAQDATPACAPRCTFVPCDKSRGHALHLPPAAGTALRIPSLLQPIQKGHPCGCPFCIAKKRPNGAETR